jgi:putative sigma-54 modulation protein
MNIRFTARRFHAHADVKDHAIAEVTKLSKFYDAILSAEVILSFERKVNSVKTAEINLKVYGGVLSAKEGSEDFIKSIDKATEKLSMQLKKYKSRLREKDKSKVRAAREKV